MKAFLWLLNLALLVLCLTGWVLAELVERSLKDLHDTGPYFTQLVIRPHWWLIVAPTPWVIWAVYLTVRKELSVSQVFQFAGALALFATLLACALAIALGLPFIPRHG
jgi:uncharacterized membrane protein